VIKKKTRVIEGWKSRSLQKRREMHDPFKREKQNRKWFLVFSRRMAGTFQMSIQIKVVQTWHL